MSEDAYAKAGVSQSDADAAVAALVAALDPRRRTRAARCSGSGHYANVIQLDESTGIALSTDGGTNSPGASGAGIVGIDCVAMNVNDVICASARSRSRCSTTSRSIAPTRRSRGRSAPASPAGQSLGGSRSSAGSRPARRADQRTRPGGACFGVVRLDSLVTGSAIEPGDAVIGLPSSGLHSNGYTLARSTSTAFPSTTSGSGGRSGTSCWSRPRSM